MIVKLTTENTEIFALRAKKMFFYFAKSEIIRAILCEFVVNF